MQLARLTLCCDERHARSVERGVEPSVVGRSLACSPCAEGDIVNCTYGVTAPFFGRFELPAMVGKTKLLRDRCPHARPTQTTASSEILFLSLVVR